MFLIFKKKNIMCLAFLFIIILFTAFSYDKYQDKKVVGRIENLIIIDPGHGGLDSGALGISGTKEKDLNLQISLAIKNKLIENGFNVLLTRNDDKMLCDKTTKRKKKEDLNNRIKIAEKYDNAIFLSIHMNHFSSEKEKGAQIFYSTNNIESEKLASIIQEKFRIYVDENNKRIYKPNNGNIYILNKIQIPAVIIECGFISNYEEEKNLKNTTYQNKIADAVLIALKDFIKNT